MKTIKFIVLIVAVMIYSYSCTSVESFSTLTSGDDSITIDASVTYDTIPENFVGFSYEKTNLRKNKFFGIPSLNHLYANFNHPGFIRIGGSTVDRCIWETYINDSFVTITKANVVSFSLFLDSVNLIDSSSTYWKTIYALPVTPYRNNPAYFSDVLS